MLSLSLGAHALDTPEAVGGPVRDPVSGATLGGRCSCARPRRDRGTESGAQNRDCPGMGGPPIRFREQPRPVSGYNPEGFDARIRRTGLLEPVRFTMLGGGAARRSICTLRSFGVATD